MTFLQLNFTSFLAWLAIQLSMIYNVEMTPALLLSFNNVFLINVRN